MVSDRVQQDLRSHVQLQDYLTERSALGSPTGTSLVQNAQESLDKLLAGERGSLKRYPKYASRTSGRSAISAGVPPTTTRPLDST